MRTLAMSATRNSARPIGGVSRPIIRLKITTMPRCTGSTPAAISGLAMMGAITSMAVVLSRNMPTTSSSTFTSSSSTQGSVEIESMNFVMACGTCSTDSTQPNSAATATMIRMAEEARSVSRAAPIRRAQVSSR